MKKLFGTLCFIVLTVFGFSQSVTLNPTIDAFVDNQSPSMNYGSSSYTYLEVGVKVLGRTTTVRRSFVQFDLSSIPKNAVITSATMIFTKVNEGSDVNNSSFSIRRVDETSTQWIETNLNWNNQPLSITSDAVIVSSSNSTERIFDVKDHVSKMVSGMYANRGWVVKRANETVLTSGSTYKSRHTTPQPRLVVNYYIPYNLSNVVYNHASSTSSANGSINVTLANGSTSTPTYKWYTNGTTLIPSATTNQLSNVGYGWYGLKVIGSQGDTSCFAFVLGVNCQNVSINFNPGPEYVDDAVLSELSVNSNIGSDYVLYASHFFMSPTYKNFKSLLKFRFWLDPNMTFNQANMLLIGNEHNTDSRSNASQLDAVTTNWSEKSVCWFNQPTSVTTTQVLIPATTTIDENKTLNMIPFMNLWKNDNSSNHGTLFKLQSSADPTATMAFNSSDATSASLRPTMSLNVFINNAVAGTVSSTNSIICNGSTTSLSLTGYSTGASFQWQKSTNGTSYSNISGATSSSYTTLASTNVNTYYRCVVTVGTCSSLNSNALLITIKPVPSLTVNNAVFCSGDNVNLTAVPSIAGGTYLWSTNETTNSINVAPSANQNYTVSYSFNGCVSNTAQATVSVCGVTSSFNETTEEGQITVDISANTTKVAPFYYQISESYIPNMSDMLNLFRDSMGIAGFDSLTFYAGSTSLTNQTFNNLKFGSHFITVFDAIGQRVFDKRINLLGNIPINNKSGITISDNKITSTTINAGIIFDLFQYENSCATTSFEITDKSKEQFFGLVDLSATDGSIIDYYKFGFKIANGNVYLINNGIVESNNTSIFSSSEFKLQQIDTLLYYSIDNVVVKSVTLPVDSSFRIGAGLKNVSTVLYFHPFNVSKKTSHFTIYNMKYYSCGNLDGGFRFVANSVLSSFNYTYEVFKDGVLISSGSSSTGAIVTILSTSTFGPGEYLIIGTPTSSGGVSFSKKLFLGYKCEWVDIDKYSLSPNNFSISRNDQAPTEYSYAKSSNLLLSSQTKGWIQFEPKYSNGLSSISVLRTSTASTNASTQNPIEEYSFITFKYSTSTYLIWTGPTFGYYPIPPTCVVRVYVDGSIVKLFVNDIQLNTNMTRPANTMLLRAHSIGQNSGLKNVVTSFGCRQSQEIFGELKYDLDGYYHIMKNGKIKFVFNQEYDQSALQFTIYNDLDIPILTNLDFPIINTLPGENYLTIDVSTQENCIGKKFYYLEIINSKKERMYLRFYNDYSGCFPIAEEPK